MYPNEKRSATNKKRGGTINGFNLNGLTSSTPEKQNNQLKGLINAINMS